MSPVKVSMIIFFTLYCAFEGGAILGWVNVISLVHAVLLRQKSNNEMSHKVGEDVKLHLQKRRNPNGRLLGCSIWKL